MPHLISQSCKRQLGMKQLIAGRLPPPTLLPPTCAIANVLPQHPSVPRLLLLGRAGDFELRHSGGKAIAMGPCQGMAPSAASVLSTLGQAGLYSPAQGRKDLQSTVASPDHGRADRGAVDDQDLFGMCITRKTGSLAMMRNRLRKKLGIGVENWRVRGCAEKIDDTGPEFQGC